MNKKLIKIGLWALLGIAGCESAPATMDMLPASLCKADQPAATMCQPFVGPLSSCKCSVDDYAPRFNGSKNDTWPSCVDVYKRQCIG